MTDFQNPRAFPSSAIDDRFGALMLAGVIAVCVLLVVGAGWL